MYYYCYEVINSGKTKLRENVPKIQKVRQKNYFHIRELQDKGSEVLGRSQRFRKHCEIIQANNFKGKLFQTYLQKNTEYLVEVFE